MAALWIFIASGLVLLLGKYGTSLSDVASSYVLNWIGAAFLTLPTIYITLAILTHLTAKMKRELAYTIPAFVCLIYSFLLLPAFLFDNMLFFWIGVSILSPGFPLLPVSLFGQLILVIVARTVYRRILRKVETSNV